MSRKYSTIATDETVRLYTVAQLAKLWGVGLTYIYDEIREGRLPVVQLGRGDRNKIRVKATDAAAWIGEHYTGRVS